MDHSQILQLLLTFTLSGASAWGGAKYAIKYLEKTSDKHEGIIRQLQCDFKKLITIDQCKDSKINCRADKVSSVKDILDKIEKLSDEVIEQNRRREDSKDDNTKLYMEISARLARLEARIETVMENSRNGHL
jgi:hypothetical protein